MLRRECYRVGAHYQQRATPILGLCHGIFTDLFIFGHILWVPDLHRFSVFMWTDETIRLRCVRMHIFLNTEKHLPFQKIPGYLWMGFGYKIMLIITTPECNKMSRPFVSYKNKKLF